jgi:hypothetical protein
MEFVVWYLGEESRASELCATYGQGWPEVELSQFMSDFLFIPLFDILIDHARQLDNVSILDKHLYSENDLQDEAKLISGTAEGYFVQRVNPELVSRIAEIPSHRMVSLAEQWYEAPEMRDFYRIWDERQARNEVVRILTELVPMAQRAVREKKVLMQLSHL